MSIRNPLIIIAVRNGLIGSIINIGALLLLFYGGKHPLLFSPILDIRIPLFGVFIFFGMKVYRDQVNRGALGFLQALAIGVICYLTISLIASIFIWIFSSFEQSHFLSDYIDIAHAQLTENKERFIESIGETAYTRAIEILPKTTGLDLAFDYLLKSMPIGLFLTLLFAILQRRKTII